MLSLLLKKIKEFVDDNLLWLIPSSLVGGAILAFLSPKTGEVVGKAMFKMIDGYALIAPLILFGIMAPSIARLLRRSKGKFTVRSLIWLSFQRLLACLFVVTAIGIIFRFPLFANQGQSLVHAVKESLTTLKKAAISSHQFWAIYASIGLALLSLKFTSLSKFLTRVIEKIEEFGKYFEYVLPLFMLAVGAYIYSLPRTLKNELSYGHSSPFVPWHIFGFSLDPNSLGGMLMVYIVMSLLTALVCFVWHLSLLSYTKWRIKDLSVKKYFHKYWSRIYPLLWATSSESLSVPLNLYLVKKYFPRVKKEIRQFVLGLGHMFTINGTLFSVFVLAAVVVEILGIQVSLLQFYLAIPVVFLIAYGVPGIPGELVLFGPAMALLLAVPEAAIGIFLTLYLGLQIGLPDSFRTGNNSTDDALYALLLNKRYQKHVQ